jgi:hypothetical protein
MDIGEMALYGLAATYAVEGGVFVYAQCRRLQAMAEGSRVDDPGWAWLAYLLPAPAVMTTSVDDRVLGDSDDAHTGQ